jgi:hypothetical protein
MDQGLQPLARPELSGTKSRKNCVFASSGTDKTVALSPIIYPVVDYKFATHPAKIEDLQWSKAFSFYLRREYQ